MAALARLDPAETLPHRGAAISAGAVGLTWIALPIGWLEKALDAIGIAALLPLAAPPVGIAARAMLALGGAALAAVVVWATLYGLFGPGGVFARRTRRQDGAPIVRRADAHPDAPPRRPLSLAELTRAIGLDAERDLAPAALVERAIPRDLDTPLSALDPGAIPLVPREPVHPVAPLAPGERMRTFALTPPPAEPEAGADMEGIEALLRRLGAGRAAV